VRRRGRRRRTSRRHRLTDAVGHIAAQGTTRLSDPGPGGSRLCTGASHGGPESSELLKPSRGRPVARVVGDDGQDTRIVLSAAGQFEWERELQTSAGARDVASTGGPIPGETERRERFAGVHGRFPIERFADAKLRCGIAGRYAVRASAKRPLVARRTVRIPPRIHNARSGGTCDDRRRNIFSRIGSARRGGTFDGARRNIFLARTPTQNERRAEGEPLRATHSTAGPEGWGVRAILRRTTEDAGGLGLSDMPATCGADIVKAHGRSLRSTSNDRAASGEGEARSLLPGEPPLDG
jgi:hypothetical protein